MEVSLITLITVMFLAMMSPGPDMVLLIKNSVVCSRKTAIFTVLGISTGITIHVSLSLFGLSVILNSNQTLYNTVKWLGAAYLIFIGLKTILPLNKIKSLLTNKNQDDNPASSIEKDKEAFKHKINEYIKEDSDKSYFTAYREGLFTNLLNPKATLFILSVFMQLIPPELIFAQRLMYGIVLIIECFVVWSAFVFLIKLRIIQNFMSKYKGAIDKVFALVLIGLGISIFFTS